MLLFWLRFQHLILALSLIKHSLVQWEFLAVGSSPIGSILSGSMRTSGVRFSGITWTSLSTSGKLLLGKLSAVGSQPYCSNDQTYPQKFHISTDQKSFFIQVIQFVPFYNKVVTNENCFLLF